MSAGAIESGAGSDVLLLHLADIHFGKGYTNTAYDLESDLRNELERDVARECKRLGKLSAILVTGDITFAAKQEEYQYAEQWLTRLAETFGCPREQVWTIPGNHDVSWETIADNKLIDVVQEALRTTDRNRLEARYVEYMQDEEMARMLFQPLAPYRQFAERMGCQFDREQPFWEKELVLQDGTLLRFRGVTSVFASGRNDREGQLVLGLASATLQRLPGVEYVFLCHHPLEWFQERKQIERMLTSRARILLFGHNHNQNLERREDAIFLAAGAIHPSRVEQGWEPRYNILGISVASDGAAQELRVEVHPRVWSTASTRFEAEMYKGEPSRRYAVEIEPLPRAIPPGVSSAVSDLVELRGKPEHQVIVRAALEAMGPVLPERLAMDDALVLAETFWTLPYHVRAKILRELSLLQDEEKSLPEEARVVLAFRRARERQLLDRLQRLVDDHTTQRR